MRVSLFITCLVDQFYPRVGVATTRVLEQLGCKAKFPAAQSCCGRPFMDQGYREQSRDLARKWVREFESAEFVVTPSPRCARHIQAHLPALLAHDPTYALSAVAIAGRTYDFASFLKEVLRLKANELRFAHSRKISYLVNAGDIATSDSPALALVRKIKNLELSAVEDTDPEGTAGGVFALRFSAIADAILDQRAQRLAISQTTSLLCEEASDMLNLQGRLHRIGVAIRIEHVAELIAEAMGLRTDSW